MTRINRRTFLQAAGLAAGSMFLPSLAGANPATDRPRRVVFMMTELGWNPFEFRMKPAGAPDELLWRSAYHPHYRDQPDPYRWELDLTRTAQDRFSSILSPLYPIRDRVLALDGLGMLSIGSDELGDAHALGWNHALSGYPAGEFITGQRAMGGRPSLDMQIARYLRSQEPHLTDLAALHLYVGAHPWGGGVDTFHHFFYDEGPSGEIIKVPTMSDARQVFDRLFPEGSAPGQETDPIDAGQRQVLDLLGQRYEATFPHLSRRDRQKLDLHRQLIADVQRRIDILSTISCEAPQRPGDIRDLPGDEALDANIEAFFRLSAVAMSCDLTRVVCMQFPNQGSILGPVYGADDRDFHEWYSHGTNPPKRWRGLEGANVTQDEHEKYLDAAPILARKNQYHLEQAVRFAELLDTIPDGEGSLLDSTLIVVMDEISHGSHGHDQWPVVLIGGFGGSFRMGRYVRFPRTNPSPAFNSSGAFAGVPHSHLLVSILQGMGLPTDTLGLDSVYARAPGGSGHYINLRGPLPELT
ncbi:MAG: DUF1552 domain-containing protein [Myxococcota bacterium]